MHFDEKLDSDILAMSDLTKKIGLLFKNLLMKITETSRDIETILKLTSDATFKITQIKEIMI